MGRKDWSDDKLLFRALNNKTEAGYWENIHALRMRPSQLLFEKCKQLINSKEQKNKKAGIDILAQLGASERPFLQETIRIYFDLLESETDSMILGSLLYAIGHNNTQLNQTQISKLCEFYEKNDDVIKNGLIFALGLIDTSSTIDVLVKLSEDQDSANRDWATFYIGESNRNNKKIREALWRRVKDRHFNTRLEAIMGLAKRNDERIKDVIKDEIKKGHSTAGLFDAILALNDVQFLPLLQNELESVRDSNDDSYWKLCLEQCIAGLSRLK